MENQKHEPGDDAETDKLWENCEASGNGAICHLCKPPQFFKTMDECMEHMREHRTWRGGEQ